MASFKGISIVDVMISAGVLRPRGRRSRSPFPRIPGVGSPDGALLNRASTNVKVSFIARHYEPVVEAGFGQRTHGLVNVGYRFLGHLVLPLDRLTSEPERCAERGSREAQVLHASRAACIERELPVH